MSNEVKTGIACLISLYLALFIICILAILCSEPIETTEATFTSRTTESTPVTTTPVTEPNFDHTEGLEYVTYFDVPMDEALQDHLFAVCSRYNIDPALVVAIIDRESDFRPKLMGDNGKAYGLMQVQLKWHGERMASLGYSDLLDPYANIAVGVDYLGELFERGKPVEWVLMAYNGGPSYANRKFEKGEVSDYARKVLENRMNLATYEKIKS